MRIVKNENEAMAHALALHPDCTFADWEPGMDGMFNMTIVVNLWRNEHCWAHDDPPRVVEQGYYKEGTRVRGVTLA